jgi:hypothetical protein
MQNFNWKLWGKGLLAATLGAAINSLATTGGLALSGAPISLKSIGIGAASAALTTVVGYLKKSPLGAATEDSAR